MRLPDEIRQLAQTVTAALVDPREKAIALNDWVRKNIRYVAVWVGTGSVVPNPVGTILTNRYGDCKDHVALLESLLTAVGIDSTPALLNSGNAYTLPTVPTLGVLDHVITYVPGLDLYLDSTAEAIAGGYLPGFDLDKPVVFTKSGALGKTPVAQAGKVENSTVFRVDVKGDVGFTHSFRTLGWGAELNRYVVKSMSSADRAGLVQNVLAAYGHRGKGTLSSDHGQPNDHAFSVNIEGVSVKQVNFPGPAGIASTTSLLGGIAHNVSALASEAERTQAFTCLSGEVEESARFEFAPGVNIIAVPNSMTVNQEKFKYTSSYLKEERAVIVRRYFKFQHAAAVCNPDEFEEMRPVIDSMLSDLKSQIVIQL